MINNSKSNILFYLFLLVAGVMVIPMLASCGKDSAGLSSNANARLQIVDLSPDVPPFNLYTRFLKGATVYDYPTASGYFLLSIADTPLQIRAAQTNASQINLLSLGRTLQRNTPYTWFITGLYADTLISILTTDTSSAPAIGRGKIRFINAAPGTLGLNLTANDTLAFTKTTFEKVTDYREVTAGSYNFNISATAKPKTVLQKIENFTVLDGKLYTIYAYGILGGPDTSAFNAGVILNTIPEKTY
jgi:hypothetical protein